MGLTTPIRYVIIISELRFSHPQGEGREVLVMVYVIDYALVSPAVLASLIESQVPNAIPMYRNAYGDFFEISIAWWDEDKVTSHDLAQIERIVAPYV